MGRQPVFSKEKIAKAALKIIAERGVDGATISEISKQSGAPVGSIYHRYADRRELTADIWLGVVEEFQKGLIGALDKDDPLEAGISAALFMPNWVRGHPVEARLLLLHHREDFFRGDWPGDYKARAETLAAELESAAAGLAVRLYGTASKSALRRVNFALMDISYGSVKRYVISGKKPPPEIDAMIEKACRVVLEETGGREKKVTHERK